MNNRLFAIIPCAGIGQRSGKLIPKQYQIVAGKNLLQHTLSQFSNCLEFAQIIVALLPDDKYFNISNYTTLRYVVRWCGGKTRHKTVLNTLYTLPEFGACDNDWVLVHDAVRPGITPDLIKRLITEVNNDKVGGLLALLLVDTLKYSKLTTNVVNNTVYRALYSKHRDNLWLAQTPQMFRLGILRQALETALVSGVTVTDEASAIEMLGLRPMLVPGSQRNFKVTWPDDFMLANCLLRM